MRSYVKDPVALIRTFPFVRPAATNTSSCVGDVSHSLVISIIPYVTDLQRAGVNENVSVMLTKDNPFGREVVADYLERHRKELGWLPFAELVIGDAVNNHTTRVEIVATGNFDFTTLQWELQVELDHVSHIMAEINSGRANLF